MLDFYILCGICTIAIVAMIIAIPFSNCESNGNIGRYNDKELMDQLSKEASQQNKAVLREEERA